jgi:phosphatidylserine/phosphatidylglycerophosphate/cardiolipin synthase-like enzyme
MINVIGRVVDENGTKLPDLAVQAIGDWLLTSKVLKEDKTDSAGQFVLQVPEIQGFDDIPRPFNLRILNPITKRALIKDRELNGVDKNQNLGDIKVNSADAAGLLVTNGTGFAEYVSEGNAIKLLVDGVEAFGQVADEIKRAKKTINLTQLFFALPPKFQHEIGKEEPALIFRFNPDLTAVDPLLTGQPTPVPRAATNDERPERLLVKAAVAQRKIKVLLNEPSISFPEGIFYVAVLGTLAVGLGAEAAIALVALLGLGLPFFPIALAFALLGFRKLIKTLDDNTNVDEAQKYFLAAITDSLPVVPRIHVRGFRQRLPKDGVFHCKMMITDEETTECRAVIMGSPFGQRYYDSLLHTIIDPARGTNSAEAVHDLSVGVAGPAARDLYDSFVFFWNEDLEGGKLQNNGPVPPAQPPGDDPICKVQVVRTCNGTRFNKLNGKSEKGILEGYLRAFAAADHYIYLENQYFTDSVITEGLVGALKNKDKPNLQVILVVPIKPDVPTYPLVQACRIKQIREAGGDRVGVFTRWAYEENPPSPWTIPWVAPVYIHAKGGVVDDSWATVGSANLDGLSLDYNLLMSPLAFGETTATELNVNIIPPSKGEVTEFALQMRKRLFAEHLGLVDPLTLQPNPEHPDLKHDRTFNWLKDLWRPRAKAALDHVKAGKKAALNGFVLEYPKEDGGCLDTPRKHLKALGINTDLRKGVVRPITGTRKFLFKDGLWDRTLEREDFKGALP